MNNDELKNISDNVALTGMKLCTNNSVVHYDAAIILSKEEMYGLAISHLILAAEESVKSLIFLEKILDGESTRNVSSFFSNHSSKHGLAKEIYKEFKAAFKLFEYNFDSSELRDALRRAQKIYSRKSHGGRTIYCIKS